MANIEMGSMGTRDNYNLNITLDGIFFTVTGVMTTTNTNPLVKNDI